MLDKLKEDLRARGCEPEWINDNPGCSSECPRSDCVRPPMRITSDNPAVALGDHCDVAVAAMAKALSGAVGYIPPFTAEDIAEKP